MATYVMQNANRHDRQALIFGSCGFSKLEQKYKQHGNEEREYALKMLERIIELGFEIKHEEMKSMKLFDNICDFLECEI